jgi:hypothetical protein
MHPMQDYFWKVFHKYYNLICTPICTKILILAKSGCYNHSASIPWIWVIYLSYEVIQSLILCYLRIYISYGRIRYCLIVYMVLCLRDHLYSGTQCGNSADPSEAIYLWWQGEVLDIAINEVSGALSMQAMPPAIRIVVVSAGMVVLLGLRNPPHSWTGTVGPTLPGFTIAPCVDSLLWYRIDQVTKVYPSRQSRCLRYVYAFHTFTYSLSHSYLD